MSQPKHAAPSGPMRGHGPGGRMMTGEKAKNFKGSTRKLLSYLKPFHWAIITVLLCAAISTVFTIVGPKVLAKATDELAKGIMAVITGGDGVIDFGYIGVVLLTLLGLYLLSALFSYLIIYVNRSYKKSTGCRWVTFIKSARERFSPALPMTWIP